MSMKDMSQEGNNRFFQDGGRRGLLMVLGCLLALLVAELFVHKHPYFEWAGMFGFFAGYGFLACLGLLFVARLVRLAVMRDEGYYDD